MTKKETFAVVFTNENYDEVLKGLYDTETKAQKSIPDNDDSQNYDIIKLSPNQRLFIDDAREQGFDIDFGYSGRGMYGKTCPSIVQDRHGDRFGTKAKVSEDSMGMDTVIYAQY